MYVLTKPDGTSFDSDTINYAENIGKVVRITDYDWSEEEEIDEEEEIIWGRGIRAARNPNDCFVFPAVEMPCRAFKIRGIQRIVGGKRWVHYRAAKVLEEVTDLDKLFGWKYSEAMNPVNPFEIKPPKINDSHIDLLKQWDSIRSSAWWGVRKSIERFITSAGEVKNPIRRTSTWKLILELVFASLGYPDWDSNVAFSIRRSLYEAAYAYTGTLFPSIKKWEEIDHKPGEYPFQPVVDLWKQGLIPTFDGRIWRLHGGKKAKVLWEDKKRVIDIAKNVEIDPLLDAIQIDPYIAYYFHKKIWLWCAGNPEKKEKEWPMWEKNGGIIPQLIAAHPACEFKVAQSNAFISTCDKYCLVDWPGGRCTDLPNGIMGLGERWRTAEQKKERSRLARQIANLPMRDRYKK